MNCPDVDELGAAFSFGALEPAQRRELLEHLERCREPHDAARSARGVSFALASSLEPIPPSPELRQRLMTTIAATAQDDAVMPRGSAAEAPRRRPLPIAVDPPFLGWLPPSWARGLAVGGVAATIVLAVVGVSLSTQLRERDDTLRAAAHAISVGSATIRIEGLAGNGYLVETPGAGAALILAGVQQLPDDRLYELWLIPADGAPVPAGTFTPAGDELAVVPVEQDLQGYELFAVTIEAERVDAPTSDPVLVAPLEI